MSWRLNCLEHRHDRVGSLDTRRRAYARHGERLREADWRRIESLRELRTAARAGPRHGTARLGRRHHRRQFRASRSKPTFAWHWREIVVGVAGWMPWSGWRRPSWWSVLPDLAPLQHLARRRAKNRLPGCATTTHLARALRREACAARPAWRPLAARRLRSLVGAGAAARVWQAEWRRRWPPHGATPDGTLAQLCPTPCATIDEPSGRRRSGAGLAARQFRLPHPPARAAAPRDPGAGAAAFYTPPLALCALDLERSRRLLRRLVFALGRSAETRCCALARPARSRSSPRRDDATLVLEALARTGAVELEARAAPPAGSTRRRAAVARRSTSTWQRAIAPTGRPPTRAGLRPFPEAPVRGPATQPGVDPRLGPGEQPVILAVQRGESGAPGAASLGTLLDTLGQRALDPPSARRAAGPWLGVRLFVLPRWQRVEAAPQARRPSRR